MSRYDEISALGFFREIPRRLDGKTALAVAMIFVAVAIVAPLTSFSIGRLHGWNLSLSALGLVPVLVIYYASLVYFSATGTASVVINTVLIAAVPILFFYFA
jgi:hypothetical protein